MLYLFIFFFFLLYMVLEFLKYERLRSFLLKVECTKRLYNKPILYIKLFVAIIDIVLIVINHFISPVERSGGIGSVLLILIFMTVLMIVPSVLEIRKVRGGYNESLFKNVK